MPVGPQAAGSPRWRLNSAAPGAAARRAAGAPKRKFLSLGFLSFREAYPDEGDLDMLEVMRVFKEVGYDGMIMPDHVPSIPGDPGDYMGGKVSMAFALGYIRALMKTVEAEGQ